MPVGTMLRSPPLKGRDSPNLHLSKVVHERNLRLPTDARVQKQHIEEPTPLEALGRFQLGQN